MLKDIRIQGTFGHQNSYFEFGKGLTAITGRNGRGKSMIQEMIQFAYFGLKALRGVSSDYPELKVRLRSWIKNQPITIERTIKGAKLFSGHEADELKPMASGTTDVNAAVANLFGYSMAVFQVANAINQKQVDAFCAMLPTARKKLVDETIGLSALEDLTKWVTEKELNFRTQISTRADLLVEPQKPIEPEGYKNSFDLQVPLTNLLAAQQQRAVHVAAANAVVVEPEAVHPEADDAQLDDYKAKVAEYQKLVGEAQALQRDFDAIGAVPPLVEASLDPDDAGLERYIECQTEKVHLENQKAKLAQEWGQIPESAYSAKNLDDFEATLQLIKRFDERAALIEKGLKYHCENCAHEGRMVDPRVNSPEFAGVPDVRPAEPPLAWHSLALARDILNAQGRKQSLDLELRELQERLNAHTMDYASKIGAIRNARAVVAAQEAALQKKRRFDELTIKRGDLGQRLVACPDKSADVSRVEKQRVKVEQYKVYVEHYKAAKRNKEMAEEALKAFSPTLDADVLALQAAKQVSLVYETNLARYNQDQTKFLADVEAIANLKTEMEEWGRVKNGITTLRTKVKGYLLPSLNKVASYLVSEFSGGELNQIVINDDFEVLVDNKRVETCSGGQKTITNLAIRIGLGQVLTNMVYPVLMMDEPDESCDDFVAEQIEKTLGYIKTKVSQILLVTHKTGREADHSIHLV